MTAIAAEAPAAPSKVGAVLRATGGNFLEMFDFFLFGLYSGPIGKAFFDFGDEALNTSIALFVFWASALMRPLGAIYLGAYVDRLGRRKGLIVTLGIMAMGTVIIAFTPTYAQIGMAAPIIVIAGRLLQGFSAGVELGGVSVYLAEIATPTTRGFVTSFQSASQQVAVFVGALIGFALNAALPAEAIAAWGWRIPFVIGCLVVPFIFVLRGSLAETPEFLARKVHPTTSQIYAAVAKNWATVVLGMLMGGADDRVVLLHHRLHARFRQDAASVAQRGAGRDDAGGDGELLLAAHRRRAVRPHRASAGAFGRGRADAGGGLSCAGLGRGRADFRQAAGGRDGVRSGLRALQRGDGGGADGTGAAAGARLLFRTCLFARRRLVRATRRPGSPSRSSA